MTDLSTEALDALAVLEPAATPGPWDTLACELVGDSGHVAWTAGSPNPFADAALIAALRNAAPALIAAARERDELLAAVGKWAAKNEIAAPPLDWAWLGEILRRYDPTHEENNRG